MTNKPMLSVEREHRLKIHRKPFLDLESGAKTCEIRDCSDRDFQVGDSVLLMLVDEAGNPTPNELRRKITHIQTGYGLQDQLCVLSYEPAAQHQGEPVAFVDERAAYEEWQWRQDWPIEQLAGARRAEYFKRKFLEPERYETDRFNSGLAVWLARATRPIQAAPVAVVMPEREIYTKYLVGVIPHNANEVNAYKDGWNTCLEEVARLNGVKP